MKRSRERVGTGCGHSPWGNQSGAKLDCRSGKSMLSTAECYGLRTRSARNAGRLGGEGEGSLGVGRPGSVGIARIPQHPGPV